MSKNILLTTICPGKADIQLALYYLKAYFEKNRLYPPSHLPTEGLPCRQASLAQAGKATRTGGGLHNPSAAKIDIDVFPGNKKVNIIAKSIINKSPDIVGFSCYVWNVAKILKVAKIIKRNNPRLKVILGGPEVSPKAKELLEQEKSIDIIASGEGEETFTQLVENLVYQRVELPTIKGISYRTKGKIFVNPARPLIDELDKIPSPYLEGLIDLKEARCAPTETMRGCPYGCHYCYYHKEFGKMRYFSPERVEQELKFILAKEPLEVYLMDPTFNVNCKRAKEILRIFIKHNKNSKLHVELRAERLDEEMIELLHKAKASFIEIGIQSTNPKTLKLINRTLEKNIFKKNVRLLNRKKMYFQIQLIDSLPADSYSDMKKSLDWLCSLHPPQIIIMRLMVLPGTYLRQHAKELGIAYDPEPPYHSYKSDAMSREDLKRVEKLRFAMSVLYAQGLLKNTIYILKKKLKINFSDIFEEWFKWKHTSNRYSKKSDNLLSMGADYTSHLRLKIDTTPGFVKYLCNKYENRSVYKEIFPVLRNDLANFLIESRKRQKSWKKKKSNE